MQNTLAREERGQDLIEYTLLIGFLALAVIGTFAGFGGSVSGIWSNAGSTISAAGTAAAAPAATPPDGGSHGGDGGHNGDGVGGSGGDGGH